MSRMDFTPLETTHTGVRPSSSKSEDMSPVVVESRWTPPTPPVAKIGMPQRWAMSIVAATVVPADACRESRYGRSRREAFSTLSDEPSCSSSVGVRPTLIRPLRMPMVAGVEPFSRMICSMRWHVSTFFGRGRPCVRMAVSQATTGRCSARADFTSGWTSTVRDVKLRTGQ